MKKIRINSVVPICNIGSECIARIPLWDASYQLDGNLLNGDVTFADLVTASFGGQYVFHGSDVRLDPGVDVLKPNSTWLGQRVIFAGDLCTALRFALVRKWGRDQMRGSDFCTFITPEYKLVVHSMKMDSNWVRDGHGEAYVYAIPSRAVDPSKNAHTGGTLPIVARSAVSGASLRQAGFNFAATNLSLAHFWGTPNTVEEIQKDVLPRMLWIRDGHSR